MLRRCLQSPVLSVLCASSLLTQSRAAHDHHDDGPKPMKAVDVQKYYIPPVVPRKRPCERVRDDQRLAMKAKLEQRRKRAEAKQKQHPFAFNPGASSNWKTTATSTNLPAINRQPGSSGKTLVELGDRLGTLTSWQVWLQ